MKKMLLVLGVMAFPAGIAHAQYDQPDYDPIQPVTPNEQMGYQIQNNITQTNQQQQLFEQQQQMDRMQEQQRQQMQMQQDQFNAQQQRAYDQRAQSYQRQNTMNPSSCGFGRIC